MNTKNKRTKFLPLALGAIMVLLLVSTASAAVWTDQQDYEPGSIVTISGDNSDGAGYLPGETVIVDVQGPNGYTATCTAIADDLGAWSCQVTLWEDESATGEYTYLAVGQTSNISQSGQFTDGPISTHNCSMMADGSIRCFGRNNFGQVGAGFATPLPGGIATPTIVSALGNNVKQITTGYNHTCALKMDGSVWCWGRNDSGQLGIGTNAHSLVPVFVNALGTDVAQITAGSGHTCALINNGSVRCWGSNLKGQLGIGTNVDSNLPMHVSELGFSVARIRAGSEHTCALMTNGSVRCWGWNLKGQLGIGTNVDSNLPMSVTTLGTAVSQIYPAGQHTCALMTNGSLRCWGFNHRGQLGNGSCVDSNIPLAISTLGNNVAQVSGGSAFSCVLTTTGGVQCWGYNFDGQLGRGFLSFGWECHPTPDWVCKHMSEGVCTSKLDSGVAQISSSGGSQCALMLDGSVMCWGHNFEGSLGLGYTYPRQIPTPQEVTALGNDVIALPDNFAYIFNQPPEANDDAYNIYEDTLLEIAVPGVLENDSDPNNDPLSAVWDAGPYHGLLELNDDGSFIYTPEVNYNGADSFTYIANDGTTDSNTATVSITVNPINDDPTLAIDNISIEVNEGGVAANNGTFHDVDVSDNVAISASMGTITQDSGSSGGWNWSLATTDGPADSQTVTITADDGHGGSAQVNFVLVVNNVPPTASFANISETVIEGEYATLLFSSPFDPSPVDTATGFRYAYDCTNDGAFEAENMIDTSFDCAYPAAGEFTARGHITDKDGGFTDYTVLVTVLTPAEATEELIDSVADLNLQQGIDNSLDAKLESVIQALEDLNENNDGAAINTLQAFINAVEAQRGKSLTDAQADQLIDAALTIINNLSMP